ncbi:hypothetical protein B0T10DRAFT_468189 [Thelonectria olida]|uniref:Embryonic stem cell-specific 5-hydroxymethylcytosine-binding protein n=1 Tax=Thelonectria olida TaxID=1576542 RepID=A0A9P8WKR8_9HYPO|nr:hypothetical protein B0T10DRAFT_468189 [Thelonectria olida]
MCGRYALALRPSQIRQMFEEDDMPVDDAPNDEGDGAPRSSYNFAPGYHGIVYRADASGQASGPHSDNREQSNTETPGSGAVGTKYMLQSMKWGLVPSWTKRNPDYGTMLKTINCRSDSLSTPGGMWASMKARKRCIVVAQGFFEWLKVGPKEKTPHFTKREDGRLMCFAGLWDCVQYQDSDEKHYTYTIITTDSNKQLKFLHDRMPVILEPGSDDLKMWLDPSRKEWSRELQSLLKPFDGKLTVYPVMKGVGKVGNNSPSFVIPLDSKENKSNIANMFARAPKKDTTSKTEARKGQKAEDENGGMMDSKHPNEAQVVDEPSSQKRKASAISNSDHVSDASKRRDTSKISATENRHSKCKVKSTPVKGQKITQFFSKSQ